MDTSENTPGSEPSRDSPRQNRVALAFGLFGLVLGAGVLFFIDPAASDFSARRWWAAAVLVPLLLVCVPLLAGRSRRGGSREGD